MGKKEQSRGELLSVYLHEPERLSQTEVVPMRILQVERRTFKPVSEEEAKCKHDAWFKFTWRGPAWECGRGCGFYLNFDPNIFPQGVAYIDKPKKEKVLPPLSISKL